MSPTEQARLRGVEGTVVPLPAAGSVLVAPAPKPPPTQEGGFCVCCAVEEQRNDDRTVTMIISELGSRQE